MSRRRSFLFGICVLQLIGLLILLALGGGDEPGEPSPPASGLGTDFEPRPEDARTRTSGDKTRRRRGDDSAAGLAGTLLLPEDVPPGRLEVVVRGEPAFGAPASASPAVPPEDGPEFEPVPIEAAVIPGPTGDFLVAGLSAGVATILVRILGEDDPVFAADDVVIAEDGATADRRIGRIDLRKVVRAITITVHDPGGLPVSGAQVSRLGTADAPGEPLRTDLNGRCLLVTALPALDLEVRHPDLRPARVAGVTSARVVGLRQRLQVRLELSAGSTIPAGERHLTARLVPVDPPARTARKEFDSGGAAVLDVDAPGRYRVEIEASGGSSAESTGITINPIPDEIDVRESADVSTWAVTLSGQSAR